MDKIYYTEGEYQGDFNINNCKTQSNDIEYKFVQKLCSRICDILCITYHDRRIVKSLLENILGEILNNHIHNRGLLYQYQAYVLDKASERLIYELNLGDVKVNHTNATHAKLADIVDKIKELYVMSTENQNKTTPTNEDRGKNDNN